MSQKETKENFFIPHYSHTHPPSAADEQKKVNEKISSNNPIQKSDLRYMTYCCWKENEHLFWMKRKESFFDDDNWFFVHMFWH